MASRGEPATRVLLVEDDASLRQVVELVFEAAGMVVTSVASGAEAVERFRTDPVDLVLLDLVLPGLDGFEVCASIREVSKVPIIMLTARTDSGAVVRGLEGGADDYVTKPFESAELLARARAVLRRTAPEVAREVLEHDGLRVDLEAYTVSKRGERLDLSATEFRLLTELLRHSGQVLTREVLLERVWNYDYLGDSRLVDMAVKRLRDKVEDDPSTPARIVTVRGVGYRYEA